MKTGVFTISLDFEIHWGVSDHRTVESYRENLVNVPAVVEGLLKLFDKRGIHATWATVGMLFCRNKKELQNWVPAEKQPSYQQPKLSNYHIIKEAGENETDDPFHYGSSLIQKIITTPNQELATHTFSHFYCLEPGQTPQQFFFDLQAAKEITLRDAPAPVSIVFPRNQYNDEYLEQCKQNGILCFRGNYPSWIYAAEAKSTESFWKRTARLADTYLPISGKRVVTAAMQKNNLLNIPASCFLRPFNKKLSLLEPLRIRRIKKEMEAAAKKKAIYHLWWHPHNFGKNMEKNFHTLGLILDHFDELKKKYNMESLTMKEIYDQHPSH